MDYNIIVRPLIGAVIGYSTNWLAIKMLFRPHEEKYIGKIRIPFTPGVIPRERERIARSLGGAVGQQLLTEEVISKELLDDRVIDHIKAYVIEDLLRQEMSLEDLLKAVLKDESDAVIKSFSKTAAAEIGMQLNNPETREVLRKTIRTLLSDKIPYNGIIGDVVSDNMASDVTGLARNNMDGITAYISELARGEQVQTRLAAAIETLVLEKVGALGAMFLDPQGMSASVASYLEALLQEDDVREGILRALEGAMDQVREKSISETVNLGLYQEAVGGITDGIMEGIYGQLDETTLIQAVAPMVKGIIARKVSLTDHQKALIEEQIEVLYKEFVTKNITTFLDTFEVSKVVESEINRFSVMEIEKLIFGIIDRELQAITWLGGLLGGIIGLVYVVL